MRVSLSGPRYAAWPQRAAYIQQLLQRVETAPGVESAGIDCGSMHVSVKLRGAAPAASERSTFASIRAVSAGYLRAMGAPLLKGRWPKDGELFGVVVNESLARSMAPRGDPIGGRISGSILSDAIVGVVADFKYRQLDAEPTPEIYMPYERFPLIRSVRVAVRTAGDPRPAAPAIQKLISEIDRSQPVYEFQTLDRTLSDSIAPRRFNMFLLGTFAAAAMLIALVGIYGAVAHSVAQRTHEIGVRMALGAPHGQIVRMVVRQGMGVALAGVAIGLGVAVGLTRLMASLLYQVTPDDPQILAAVAVILTANALLACWVPARRAVLVDPLIALRYE